MGGANSNAAMYVRCGGYRNADGTRWNAHTAVRGFRWGVNGVERRVDRGARWMLASDYVRASYRDVSKVVTIQDIIGFPCEWCMERMQL